MRNLGGLLLRKNILQVSFNTRLDYIFISNTLQELVTTTELLTTISSDHFPVLFSLSKKKTVSEVNDFENLIAT